jgi:hypothetical protein
MTILLRSSNFQSAATNRAVFSLNEKSEYECEKWPPTIPLHSVPEAVTNKAPAPNLKNLR